MKRLFSLLSILGLLGISTLSYGEWRQNSGWLWADPDERSCEGSNCYKGDCREMMCQYGCIEDPEGKGHCASSGQSGEVCYGGLGCQEGLVCSSLTDMGICTGACPEHSSTTESSWQIGETGCYCEPGYVLNETDDGCVEGKTCSSNTDCTSGYFCKYPVQNNDWLTSTTTCKKPNFGSCSPIQETRKIGDFTAPKSIGIDVYMDFYSAENWCAALGMELADAHELCTDEEYKKVLNGAGDCGSGIGYRHCTGWEFPKDAGGVNRYWTATPSEYFSCGTWAVSLSYGTLVPCYSRSSNKHLARPLCKSSGVGEGADCSKSPCQKGYFCSRINNGWSINEYNYACANPYWHNCYSAGKGMEVTYKGENLKQNVHKNLSYWSAQDWCAAHNRHLASLSDLGITPNGSNGWNGVNWEELQVFFTGLTGAVDLFVSDTPHYCGAYTINNNVKGVSSVQRNQDTYMWMKGGLAGTYSSGCICK